METVSGLLARDALRQSQGADGQLRGRGTTDPAVLSDFEFHAKHGMTREQYIERDRQWKRADFESAATGDIDESLDGLAGAPADKYLAYHGVRTVEDGKLADLQRKAAELESIIGMPVESEGAIRAALRRTADALLSGKSAEESDADKRAELDSKLAAHKHKAEAARIALDDIAKDIDRQQVRCARVKERESDFLPAVVLAAVERSGMVERLQALRSEADELETLLQGLRATFGGTLGVAPRDHRTVLDGRKREWAVTEQWKAVADALRTNPCADVARLLPKARA